MSEEFPRDVYIQKRQQNYKILINLIDMKMTQVQLQQAVAYVVSKHDPKNTGSLHAEMIQSYLNEMAQFGGHPLKCDTVYLAELLVQVLDNEVTFGAQGLADVYRFVQGKHGIFETPVTYSDFKEVHNPDGSTCTVSRVQTVEFHTELSHPHHHSHMAHTTNPPHINQPVAQSTHFVSNVVGSSPMTITHSEQPHPVGHSTVYVGQPHFFAPVYNVPNPTYTTVTGVTDPTVVTHPVVELNTNFAHSRAL